MGGRPLCRGTGRHGSRYPCPFFSISRRSCTTNGRRGTAISCGATPFSATTCRPTGSTFSRRDGCRVGGAITKATPPLTPAATGSNATRAACRRRSFVSVGFDCSCRVICGRAAGFQATGATRASGTLIDRYADQEETSSAVSSSICAFGRHGRASFLATASAPAAATRIFGRTLFAYEGGAATSGCAISRTKGPGRAFATGVCAQGSLGST